MEPETKDWLLIGTVIAGLIGTVTAFLSARRKQAFDENSEIFQRYQSRIAKLEADNDKKGELITKLSESLGEARAEIRGLTATVGRLEEALGTASDRAADKTAELAVAKIETAVDAAVAKAAVKET